MRLKNVDWPNLLRAFGMTLIVSSIIGALILIGKYAPAVLLILAAVLLMWFFYYLLKMIEEP